MLRKFIQCRTTMERLQLLADCNQSDFTEQELDTILNIMGVDTEEEWNKENKWSVMICKLMNDTSVELEALEGGVFKDVKEKPAVSEKELKQLGDLKGYMKVCGKRSMVHY